MPGLVDSLWLGMERLAEDGLDLASFVPCPAGGQVLRQQVSGNPLVT